MKNAIHWKCLKSCKLSAKATYVLKSLRQAYTFTLLNRARYPQNLIWCSHSITIR